MAVKCFSEQCNESFNNLSTFTTHVRLFHKYEKVSSYRCTLGKCNRTFASFQNLKKHLMSVHEIPSDQNGEPEETCSIESVKETRPCPDTASVERNDLIQDVQVDPTLQNHPYQSEYDDDALSNEIQNSMFLFLLKLHGKSNLTKSIICEIFRSIKEDLLDKITDLFGVDEKMSKILDDSYNNLNTQYKFEKRLEKNDFITGGMNEVISFKAGNVYKNGEVTTGEIKETVTIMPIKKMFRRLFSLSNVLKDVTDNMQALKQKNTISNFVNGARWKDIQKNYAHDDILIPYDLYQDDFETGNALGSNSGVQKVSAFYISFPTFPSHLLSSPKYVFEALLYQSHLNKSEMFNCLERFVLILKEIEENGIDVVVDGVTKKVYFALARVVGDNLALNEILGFTKSFNAHQFCRICTLSREQTQKCVISSDSYLRTVQNYEEELKKRDTIRTAIRQECIFNKLKNFHCALSRTCDIMHDLMEGIAKSDMPYLLKELIDDETVPELTLEKLNALKQTFGYGSFDIGNLSRPIEESHLKNLSLKMSGSEMRTFLKLVPLMIGHLVPRDNAAWKMILTMEKLAELAMLPHYGPSELEQLKTVIISYNTQYKKMMKKPLRPKNHFVSHYIQSILQNGPLRTMMTYVYETKNKEVKSYANVMQQRINIAQSLAYKSAMRFNCFITEHLERFPKITSYDRTDKPLDGNINEREYYKDLKPQDIDAIKEKGDKFVFCKSVSHKNSKYSIDDYIVDDQRNPTKLLKIYDIVVLHEDFFFILDEYEIVKYDDHFSSYFAGKCLHSLSICNIKDCDSVPFALYKTVTGSLNFKIKRI